MKIFNIVFYYIEYIDMLREFIYNIDKKKIFMLVINDRYDCFLLVLNFILLCIFIYIY